MTGWRKDCQQTKKKLAEYKARLVHATARSDAFNATQLLAERSDALNTLPKLTGIATEGALNHGGRVGKVADSIGRWRIDTFSS